MKLDGKKVLMVIPYTQFRDEEFFEPKKLLEEEGAKVVVASTAVRACRGMKGGIAQSEITIADAKADDYSAIVVCGGSSVARRYLAQADGRAAPKPVPPGAWGGRLGVPAAGEHG